MSDLTASLPRIRQKVELQILEGPYAAAYSALVDDVDQTGITLQHPLLGGRLVPLLRGQTVRVEYGIAGAARIAFQSRVEALQPHPYPTVRIATPDPLKIARFQQRSFVRLPTSLDLRYRILEGGRPNLAQPPDVHGEVLDLSASGIRVLLPDRVEAGTRLLVEFTLGQEALRLVAEVVRQIGTVAPRRYTYGLHFTSIDEVQQQVILRFIFAEQRALRQKGLL